MGSVNIIVIGLMVYDVILTAVCAKLFLTASENKFKSDIDRIKIEYLEKKCDINTESINLLLESIKDLNGIVKKVVKEIVKDDEYSTDTKPDVNALVAGWKADEQEEQKLFSADEVREGIVKACNSGMLLQSALLAQGFAQT